MSLRRKGRNKMSELSTNSFYDSVSDFYDEMTSFKDRYNRESKIMEHLSRQFEFKQVLDAACGTGIHTIALSNLSIESTGIDNSPEMIKKAKINAKKMHTQAEFKVLALHNTKSLGTDNFDTVLILGNSLPHILNNDDLFQSLNSLAQVLKSSGKLIIQILNYKKILKNKERIISIKKQASSIYVRFYDFLKDTVRFNLLSIDPTSSPMKHHLYSTILKPYIADNIVSSLKSCGFSKVSLYGALDLRDYDPLNSENLIIVAETV